MNYEDAVGFYHSLLRFGVNPGLERTLALCEELGSPQKKLKCIHVAGTNGKGSTCTFIAGVLQKAGYKTGLYTSPYVIEFRERIRLDGEFISKDDLVSVTERVKCALQKENSQGIYPTEFEAITAAAFLYYTEKRCDVVVLETGLGGRFDATNIIENPLAEIITSVSLDHTKVLGDTIEKIAWEKAGIIKPRSAVITSVNQHPDALRVISDTAKEMNARLILADDKKMFSDKRVTLFGTDVSYNGQDIHISIPGVCQPENLSLCLECFTLLKEKGYNITDDDISNGISSAFIPARTEILSRNPLVILDGSHNDSSTKALAELLKKTLHGKRILAVMGMMADKDIKTALDNLMPCFDEVIAVTPTNPRAMTAEDFSELVVEYQKTVMCVPMPTDGINSALNKLNNFDALVICGSLYLASDVREYTIQKLNSEVN